jgi:putative phosphoesterase
LVNCSVAQLEAVRAADRRGVGSIRSNPLDAVSPGRFSPTAGVERLAAQRDSVFDATMRIGVISDTHGLLRREALDALAGVEHVIHAGDIGSPDILPRLEEIAPVTAIRGNVDKQAWLQELPSREVVTIAGRTICIIHDLGELELDPVRAGFDLVVSGHTHRPRVETIAGVVYLNPGSAGPRRFALPVTLATVDLTAEAIRPAIHELVG